MFHFSEEPSIQVFVPRAPVMRPDVEPMVWAVDDERAWTYLFPRECPRVLLWPTGDTTAPDLDRWFGGNGAARIACIEWRWLAAMHSTALYRYEMDPAAFRPLEDDPWMLVSQRSETPMSVKPVGDLVQALADAGVELRLMPRLTPLFGAWEHSFHFSGIRLRNAVDWPETAPSPLPRISQ
ncbi:MAG: DUF6886 family protein [bacterium]